MKFVSRLLETFLLRNRENKDRDSRRQSITVGKEEEGGRGRDTRKHVWT